MLTPSYLLFLHMFGNYLLDEFFHHLPGDLSEVDWPVAPQILLPEDKE